MAEARRATIVDIPEDRRPSSLSKISTFKKIWNSYTYSFVKQYYRFKNRVLNGLYPSKPKQSLVIMGTVFTASALGYDPSFGIIEKMEVELQKYLELETPRDHIVAVFIFSIGAWIVISTCRKWILYYLLCYHGWMYDDFGRVSFKTKLWALALKTIAPHSTPQLYSYQRSLPFLPVPKLKDTLHRYLKSMRPLLDNAQYESLEKLAMEYKKKHGIVIQFFLYVKYLFSSNYVSDWWENYVYLINRHPLIINSNYYGMDSIFYEGNWLQSARASNMICAFIACMNLIKTEKLNPIRLMNVVPLCSQQYERAFATTRIPRFVGLNDTSGDNLVHLNECEHIVILRGGRFFKLPFKDQRRYLEPVEVEQLIIQILEDNSEVNLAELRLPVLTAGERNHWAETRNKYFASGVNKNSLDIIENAAFVLILEDYKVSYDPNDPTKMNDYAHSVLHGKGYDRWFDKSFNLVIYKNGQVGFNAEHSWADAPIMGHIWEYVLLEDVISPAYGYAPNGHCRGLPARNLPKPTRLQWEIKDDLSKAIRVSLDVVEILIKDVDLYILIFSEFGKGIIKKCQVSPDGFIQIALQLTYFKTMGHFCQTYEASMTRLYREGRTETVRSCTMESCAFVRSMVDKNETSENRVKLFRAAIKCHQKLYKLAMTGCGVDRHLFCQYIVCRFLRINSDFLRRALAHPWRLSTSQTPHGQTPLLDLKRYPNFVSAGGGFGPVADNGFGISYIIGGEDRIFFHISSKFSCLETSSKDFATELVNSLRSLRDLFN